MNEDEKNIDPYEGVKITQDVLGEMMLREGSTVLELTNEVLESEGVPLSEISDPLNFDNDPFEEI